LAICRQGHQNREITHASTSANIGGPLSKKASFFFNLEGRNVIDLHIWIRVRDPQ